MHHTILLSTLLQDGAWIPREKEDICMRPNNVRGWVSNFVSYE